MSPMLSYPEPVISPSTPPSPTAPRPEARPRSVPALVSAVTRQTRPHMPRPPVLSSADSPWSGFTVEQFSSGPADATDESPVFHHVVIQLDRPTTFEQRAGGQIHTFLVPPGAVCLFPAMQPVSVRNRDTREFLVIAIDPRFVTLAAHEIAQSEHFELSPQIAIDDALVRGIGLALRAEIQSGYPGGKAYGELLAHTLAAHLVRHYSAKEQTAREDSGGLGRRPLRLVLDYIQEHLAEDISLETLAKVAGLSPFHFARLFKRSVGIAPHQYLIRHRVERAKELLLTTPHEIAEVAALVGFCDQSHLTSHFKRTYGIAPGAFLRSTTSRISAANATNPRPPSAGTPPDRSESA